MSYEEIKAAIQVIFSEYVGSGKIIDDTDSGVTPSALAILLGLVHNRISGYPAELNCLRETGTIVLTGAFTYNLKTLFPGLKTVYQIYGINQYQEHDGISNSEANITPVDGWSVRGDTLIFTGTSPSGTASIQYKSNFLVKDQSGARQRYFLADTDTSCLDEDDVNVLIFGLGQFVNWKSDTESQDRRLEVMNWYKEAWNNIILNNKQSRMLTSML